ncbi:hypothetical protein A3D77_03380 [Candidatus Gottesmanbacteria bacterium RIFCSPHIGHO2_02_FULL_39_11]|uniref:Uncharacterized protein n=1 Tax=Candidatus Gottesmanbacteria bacterium RIFCSPHIGHO2_02_FULL_39_11 TaxID=1798382 RepID=A0A1F5ZNB9_9BACT|nr:MAG: hypothetical protein A3D77_03380 [Candidatus Gottesmanbacteria bacterium RIFCSPHIGHO2_02_FULL_39_11]
MVKTELRERNNPLPALKRTGDWHGDFKYASSFNPPGQDDLDPYHIIFSDLLEGLKGVNPIDLPSSSQNRPPSIEIFSQKGIFYKLDTIKEGDALHYLAQVRRAEERPLFTVDWERKMAKDYTNAFLHLLFAVGDTDPPAIFTISILDEILIESTYKAPPGWIMDYGPGIFINKQGRLELPGREEDKDHEAWHRVLEYEYPSEFHKLFRPHPYLDESLAISYNILSHQSREASKKNPSDSYYPYLPSGMEQSYITQLIEEDIMEPPTTRELDGGNTFDSSLYPGRFLLSLTIETLIRGLSEEHTITTPPDRYSYNDIWKLVNHGILTLQEDQKDPQRVTAWRNTLVQSFYTIIRMLHINENSPNTFSQETTDSLERRFWYSFFGGSSQDPEADSYESPLDYTHQHYAGLILPLYMLIHSRHTAVQDTWDNFSDSIKLRLLRKVPTIEKYIKSKTNEVPPANLPQLRLTPD